MQSVADPRTESVGRHIRATGKTAPKMNAPQDARQDFEAFLRRSFFLNRLGRIMPLRRGGFALARIFCDHRQQM